MSFMFASGIENSNPTIANGRIRRDQMAECGHYIHWRRDFALAAGLGIRTLRYGVPLHRSWLGPQRYDWEFADQAFAELRRLGIQPIADLCHFGVPDWIGNFQNPDFPRLFACYAADFAPALPLDPDVHPGQRDVRLRPLLGTLRPVERTTKRRARLRHCHQAPGQSQPAGHARDPDPASRHTVHTE